MSFRDEIYGILYSEKRACYEFSFLDLSAVDKDFFNWLKLQGWLEKNKWIM